MSMASRASLSVAFVFIVTVGCKGDRPATPGAARETIVAVPPSSPPPPAPSVDAAADRFDAATAALPVAPSKTTHRKSTPSQPPEGGGRGRGVSALQATGSQPKAVVEAYIRGKSASLLSCYAKSREQHPGQHGRLYLKLTMNERGVVELAEVVKSTISDDDGQMCVVEAIQRFKFPPTPGGGQSTATFQLGL